MSAAAPCSCPHDGHGETQHWTNLPIQNYVDALSLTALTTTGSGDVTVLGTAGRLISIIIMIFGVTLFVRLIRALLQPTRCAFPAQTADCRGKTWTPSTVRPAEPH
jgi:hypothetical protein